MRNQRTNRTRMSRLLGAVLGVMGLGLMVWSAGCGGSDAESDNAQDDEPQSSSAAAAPPPMPEIPEDAPVLEEMHPTLTDGALRRARLIDLPDGTLVRTDDISVTEADLEAEIEQVPEAMREQVEQNQFFALEQKATQELLAARARRQIEDADALGEAKLLSRYFAELAAEVKVTDEEVETFYEENPDLLGDTSLKDAKTSIREHLQQEKAQDLIEDHIADMGKQTTIALSADWVETQAERTLDNPVDNARANGQPTFVNFGADGCKQCAMMEPIREKLAEEFQGQLDVVFVQVQQQQLLASRYGVNGIPHLVFFDENGEQVHAHTGFMPEEQVRKWLEKSGVKDS